MQKSRMILAFSVLIGIFIFGCQQPSQNTPNTPAATQNKNIILSDSDTGGFVRSVSIAENGKWLVAGFNNGKILHADLIAGTKTYNTIDNLTGQVAVRPAAGGKTVAFKIGDGSRVIAGVTDFKNDSWAGKFPAAFDMDTTPDLSVVAIVTLPPYNKNGELFIETNKKEKDVRFSDSGAQAVSVSGSGKFIAVGNEGFDALQPREGRPPVDKKWGFNGVSLYDKKGQLHWKYKTASPVDEVKVIEERSIVLAMTDASNLIALNLKTGKKIWSHENAAWFAANDKYILSGSNENAALFDINGELIWKSSTYTAVVGGPCNLALTEDGISIIYTSLGNVPADQSKKEVVIFDKSGKVVWSEDINTIDMMTCVAISVDGKTWAVGTEKLEVFRAI